MDPKISISQKLTLVLVVFAAALLLGVGLSWYANGRNALETAIKAELNAIAAEKEAALVTWINYRLLEIAAISLSPSLQRDLAVLRDEDSGADLVSSTHLDIVESIKPRTGEAQPFISILILDPETGMVIASSNPNEEGRSQGDRPFFLEGKKAPFLQSLYDSVYIQGPAMTVSAPIRDKEDELIGVIAGRLNLQELNAIINQQTEQRQTLDIYMVTRSSLFATQPRFAAAEAVQTQGAIRTEAVARCVAGETGIILNDDYRNVPVVSAYQWLSRENLCLIVELEQAEAFAETRALGENIVLIGGAALLVAFLIAAGLAHTLTRPIRRFQSAFVLLREGDREHRLPEDASDELGILAREFNHMVEAVSNYEEGLRERAEQLAEANRQLEAFSYSVSHDLRAPLRAIDGFSRILLEDYGEKLDADGNRYVNIIRNNTQQMGRLIDDLLAFSRISRQALSTGRVNIGKLVHDLVAGLDTERAKRRIEIEIGELPPCQGDASLLRQVFQNVISNAVKYTRQREVARIEIGSSTLDGETVYYVRDNGAGFDMKYAGKLFGVFQRLHRAEDFEGTGVGLAIVQRIVQRHGGRIWAESGVDRGATFYFTIPGGKKPQPESFDADDEVSLIERARELV